MILNNPIKIKGTKGVTVNYKINNLRIESGMLKWDSFPFYTPVGDQTDENGQYFSVPAKEYIIPDRDDVDIEVVIKVTKEFGVEPSANYVGAAIPPVTLGKEGDVIITGYIPADPNCEIEITPKEVI